MRIIFPLAIVSLLTLPACTITGLATGAGASAGIAAAQEGGLKRAYSDAKIQTAINRLWFEYDTNIFLKLDMTVNQGRVLLTGVVQDPAHRVEAVRLAWQPPGVEQVINEIRVDEGPGIIGFARDSWITTRLRTQITIDRDIQSINYNIDTVKGVIYLMGVAQSRAELNKVIETARTIPDVKQVVSYVKFAGEKVKDLKPQQAGIADQSGAAQGDTFREEEPSGQAESIEWAPPPGAVRRERLNP